MRLDSSVHYSQNFDNALWNGNQMIYGDGDGEIFGRFTTAVDVIGHELTHGVTQFEAGLEYHGQSGALNESISDVFGSLVKQHVNNQTAAQADWLIGVGLFKPGVVGQAIRSMKAPAQRTTIRTWGRILNLPTCATTSRPMKTMAECTSIPAFPTMRFTSRQQP